mmetsp:Transcript_44391/g.115371  ORF Transcript_44391/g.115371 Transcript_44391/m.115371 type:complete len:208 (-) Transcript_44391:123-746(-)
MEEGEGEDNSLKFSLLGAGLERLIAEGAESTEKIGLQAFRGLVSELDRVLENALRDLIARLGSQEYSEILMCTFHLVHSLLQPARGPLGRKMDVLENDPATMLVCVLKGAFCDGLLTLTERNVGKLGSIIGHAEGLSEGFNISKRVRTRAEHEENSSLVISIGERSWEVVRDGVRVFGIEHLLHEAGERLCHSVGPKTPDDTQLVEV